MYKFPIKIPEGSKLFLAQAFRAEPPVTIATAYSTSTAFHNGVDITCGTPQETWGRECVWPFPFPGVVYDAEVDAPLGAKLHAHSQIDGTDPLTGIKYSLVYLHLSAVTKPKAPIDSTVIAYAQGDVIGRIGNNGFVNPAPTAAHPLDGSHLHFGVGVQKPGELNSTMVDPLIYFDLAQPFYAPSSLHYNFMVNLAFGQQSGDIWALQKALQSLGLFPANTALTGYYGTVTASAVLQFRVKYNISSSNDPQGKAVGPLTRAQLNNLFN